MTYHGTNTWRVEDADGLSVIDPGPDDAGHVAAILAACGGAVARIVLTHTHPDHVGAAAALKAATGAQVYGWGKPWLKGFTPDIAVADGDRVGALTAVYTPGHASDHLCFAWGAGALFSGDHVMSWNTSIVSPPDGDMAAYMDGLRLLLARDDLVYYCGHGAVLPEPAAMVRAMLVHRIGREAAVLAALGRAPVGTARIVDALYAELDARLKPAAERSVLAHLLKLEGEGRARRAGEEWWTG
jgi:glyoxylase-like metal-dependent hydrolase (beta-lactamase superfamily II)